jgi:hypothetical protein
MDHDGSEITPEVSAEDKEEGTSNRRKLERVGWIPFTLAVIGIAFQWFLHDILWLPWLVIFFIVVTLAFIRDGIPEYSNDRVRTRSFLLNGPPIMTPVK